MSTDRAHVTLLEELNFNAWPAIRTMHYDGWLLRSSGGSSRRVNSINPMMPGQVPLNTKIEYCETVYARWGRPAIFRLGPLADAGLDERLGELGYKVQAPTFVQTADAETVGDDAKVQFMDRAYDQWLKAAFVMRSLTGEDAMIFAAQHRSLGVQTSWAWLLDGLIPAAIGVVCLERGWAGLHGIYVDAKYRRKGMGRRISQALIGHALKAGATKIWLQVEQNNDAAIRLYENCGFRTAYGYHHRMK